MQILKIYIEYSDQTTKIFEVPKDYLVKLDYTIQDPIELRNQLEWIRTLEI